MIDELKNIKSRHRQRYGSRMPRVGTDEDVAWLLAAVDRLRDRLGGIPPADSTLEGESNAVRQ
jgi:hypothetical protein